MLIALSHPFYKMYCFPSAGIAVGRKTTERDWLQDKSEGLGFCSDERRIATHGFYQA